MKEQYQRRVSAWVVSPLAVLFFCGMLAGCGAPKDEDPYGAFLGDSLKLYDAFDSGDTIDTGRWRVREIGSGTGSITQSNGILSADLGGTSLLSDSVKELEFIESPYGTVDELKAFAATVILEAHDQTAGDIRARLGGQFFKSVVGIANYEIYAEIRLQREQVAESTTVNVYYEVISCPTIDCDSGRVSLTGGPVDMNSTALLGRTAKLYIGYNGREVFTFQHDDDTPQTYDTRTAGHEYAGPSEVSFYGVSKSIGVRADAGTTGSVQARFDNVRVGY